MDLENHIGFLVASTFSNLNNLLSRKLMEANIELPSEQSKLLNFISYHEGITQQELAAWIHKLKPGVSRMADQLEQRQFIERRYDSKDRRNKRIYVTEKGRDLLVEIRQVQKFVLASLHEGINPDDLEVFKTVIKKVRDNAQKQLI